ncbi:hypothetical protein FHG87_021396 [Trinorchestia longiramus]|nr:hypothetical protein FHG87_021396 [Trinorchestia longiramus]
MYRVLAEDLGKKSYKMMKPRSLDLNHLNFSICSILQPRVLANPCTSVESLKAKLQREWEVIPLEQIRAACDAFVNRLKIVSTTTTTVYCHGLLPFCYLRLLPTAAVHCYCDPTANDYYCRCLLLLLLSTTTTKLSTTTITAAVYYYY